MEYNVFYCVVCLFVSFFSLCASGGKSSKNEWTILAEGQLDGKNVTRSDLSSAPIVFEEGQILNITCSYHSLQQVKLKLEHEKGNDQLFYVNEMTGNCRLNMILYSFDNDSTLSCVLLEENTLKEQNRLKIPLRFKKDLHSSVSTYKKKNIEVGKTFEMACENESRDTRIFSASDNEIVTYQQHKFNVTDNDYGKILFCIDINLRTDNKHVLIIERVINNITILKSNTNDGVIPTYDANKQLSTSLLSSASSSSSSSSSSSPSSKIYIIIAVACVTSVGLFIFIILTYCKYTKRKRAQETQDTNTMNEIAEPANSTPHHLIYAELQLRTDTRERDRNKTDNETTYAEIKGVLAPKRNETTK